MKMTEAAVKDSAGLSFLFVSTIAEFKLVWSSHSSYSGE